MTNVISSAVEAISALIKLQSKSALVRVEFAVFFVSFSFEGYISQVDSMTLSIEGIEDAARFAPRLIVMMFGVSTFLGEIEQDDAHLRVSLSVTRPAEVGKPELQRLTIVGEWFDKELLSRSRIN